MNPWYSTLNRLALTPHDRIFSPVWTVSALLALLLVPYLVWVLFATYVNQGFYRVD